jgi:hypothetical protein
MRRLVKGLVLLLLAAGCVATSPPEEEPPPVDNSLKVMTWNLYLGTDFESLFDVASLDAVPAATAAAWAAVQASDFADRAEAIADRIAAEQPHLIGLQEVELYRLQSPGDGWNGQPATEVALDFLALLQQALTQRSLAYDVAVSSDNVDFEAPMATATGSDDIRITDRDLVLARHDVVVENPQQHHFADMTSYPIPGTPFRFSVPKAWIAVEATLGERRILFVNTHLEIGGSPATVQEAQGAELAQAMAAIELPTVLVGDLNAEPGSTVYQGLVDAGFQDAWSLTGNTAAGTCCQAADLRNQTSALLFQIDHVLLRGELGASAAALVGALPEQRSPGGRWPSDHAGMVATVR